MKLINWAARGFGTILVILSFFTISQYFLNGALPLRGLSNKNGLFAIVIGSMALAIWIARKIYVEMKKRKYPDFELTRQVIHFLRQNHILFGWIALITATAHGIYYLTVTTDKTYYIFTGWFAWGALCVLTAIGIWFEKRLSERKKLKTIKAYHIGLAFVFASGALLHLL